MTGMQGTAVWSDAFCHAGYRPDIFQMSKSLAFSLDRGGTVGFDGKPVGGRSKFRRDGGTDHIA